MSLRWRGNGQARDVQQHGIQKTANVNCGGRGVMLRGEAEEVLEEFRFYAVAVSSDGSKSPPWDYMEIGKGLLGKR